MQQKINKYFIF